MTAAPSNNKAFILKKIAVKTFLCEHSSTKSQFLQPWFWNNKISIIESKFWEY
jgi:hypothetical protein